MKQQDSNSDGPDAVCGEFRETTMVSRVRRDYEEKMVRARSWEPWVTAELDSIANIC